VTRYLVDTNVISELMRPEPHPAVLAWVAAQRMWEHAPWLGVGPPNLLLMWAF
jgi:hypothetical protein